MNARIAIAWIGAVCVTTVALVSHAAAAERWLALGADAGAVRYDGQLADYQWDVSPRGAWGFQAQAGLGRLGLGARLSGSATDQRLGLDGVTDPHVEATRVELVATTRLARLSGLEIAALGSLGRQRLSYHPSQLEIPNAGSPITVDLAPIESWIGGGGVSVEHALAGPWHASFALEHRWFALDTAHDSGGQVVDGRETFGMWDARLGVNWLVASR